MPRLRNPSVLPSHVTWVTLRLARHLNAPARRAPGRLAGSSGGFRWVGVGSHVQLDHRLVSIFLMIDPTEDGWHGAGGLFLVPGRLIQSLCTAAISVRRNPANGRLYFLIVATSPLMNRSLLPPLYFLLLCASFIHCKEKTFCVVRTNKIACWKREHSLSLSVCFLFLTILVFVWLFNVIDYNINWWTQKLVHRFVV